MLPSITFDVFSITLYSIYVYDFFIMMVIVYSIIYSVLWVILLKNDLKPEKS